MAVFTPVSDQQASLFLTGYDLGRLWALHPIAEGVENTNYRLETTTGRFVLTLFEGRTDAGSLPFCLGLSDHLAGAGVPAARPVRDRRGDWIGALNGRPAALLAWLPGAWLRAPSQADRAAAGAALARLHLAAADYGGRRENPVGPGQWRALADRCAGAASGEDRDILMQVEAALEDLGDLATDSLPHGPVHADYFPDNVLFEDKAVSGVIDLYFGCVDALAYDLAIALSAWGFDAEGGEIPGGLDAFRAGYEAVRPLSPAEALALPKLGQAAGVRFTLTRLHDRVFHDPTKLVTPKDPAAFLRRVAWWRDSARLVESGGR